MQTMKDTNRPGRIYQGGNPVRSDKQGRSKTQYFHNSVRTADVVLVGERSHNTYQHRNFPDSLFLEKERESKQDSNINNELRTS